MQSLDWLLYFKSVTYGYTSVSRVRTASRLHEEGTTCYILVELDEHAVIFVTVFSRNQPLSGVIPNTNTFKVISFSCS